MTQQNLIFGLVGCGDKADIDQKTLVEAFPADVRAFFDVKDIKLDKTNKEGNHRIDPATGSFVTHRRCIRESFLSAIK